MFGLGRTHPVSLVLELNSVWVADVGQSLNNGWIHFIESFWVKLEGQIRVRPNLPN